MQLILDLLYPARCSACDAACAKGASFCTVCSRALEPIVRACGCCGLPTTGPKCIVCLVHAPPFVRASSAFAFGGPLADAIRRFKWGRLPSLAKQLGPLLSDRSSDDARLVIPVPLHSKRLRQREFNQSALLARAAKLSGQLELDALVRVRDTPPQAELNGRQRRDNVRGAFRARGDRVSGRRVLLVDDVLTTGATAEACTRALLDAGASEVVVLTLARAMP